MSGATWAGTHRNESQASKLLPRSMIASGPSALHLAGRAVAEGTRSAGSSKLPT